MLWKDITTYLFPKSIVNARLCQTLSVRGVVKSVWTVPLFGFPFWLDWTVIFFPPFFSWPRRVPTLTANWLVEKSADSSHPIWYSCERFRALPGLVWKEKWTVLIPVVVILLAVELAEGRRPMRRNPVWLLNIEVSLDQTVKLWKRNWFKDTNLIITSNAFVFVFRSNYEWLGIFVQGSLLWDYQQVTGLIHWERRYDYWN